VARRYVRFATHAAKKAAAAHPHLDPTTVAKAAVVEAAKKYAPGLLAPLASLQTMGVPRPGVTRQFQREPVSPTFSQEPTSQYRPSIQAVGQSEPTTYSYGPSGQYQPQCPSCGGASGHHRRQGKWIRRGRHIVLLGV
jgi:hypothetical protein